MFSRHDHGRLVFWWVVVPGGLWLDVGAWSGRTFVDAKRTSPRRAVQGRAE